MGDQLFHSQDTVEFTYRWYRDFLNRIRATGRDIRRFADDVGDGDVVLRHDVDLSLERAVRMARIEAEESVRATYCVLLTTPLYNPLEGANRKRLREIESLGHEIALHFSTHEYWNADVKPDASAIRDRVADERSLIDVLRSTQTDTVSFHSPPSWVFDRPFDGMTSAYAPAYFGDATYVADSNQRWRERPPDVGPATSVTQVLTHPGLWGETDEPFDARIAASVDRASSHADRKARREFLGEEDTR